MFSFLGFYEYDLISFDPKLLKPLGLLKGASIGRPPVSYILFLINLSSCKGLSIGGLK